MPAPHPPKAPTPVPMHALLASCAAAAQISSPPRPPEPRTPQQANAPRRAA